MSEISCIHRYAQDDLVTWKAMRKDILNAALTGLAKGWVHFIDVTRGWKELSVMARDVCPGSREVVAHEVQKVEQIGGRRKIDVLEAVFADWERGAEDEEWCREGSADGF